jgi:hypothetical protein
MKMTGHHHQHINVPTAGAQAFLVDIHKENLATHISCCVDIEH